MHLRFVLLFVALSQLARAADPKEALKSATVRLMMGDGGGSNPVVSPGVLFDRMGSVATCSSNIYRYSEFQAILPHGEIYNQMWLTGHDSLREIAVLRIAWGGGGAPVIAPLKKVNVGAKLLFGAFDTKGELGFVSATVVRLLVPDSKGVVTIETRDDFNAIGFCGSGAFNENGELVGIVNGNYPGGHLVIPVESISSLAYLPTARALGDGSRLTLNPAGDPARVSEAAVKVDGQEWKKDAKTIHIRSETSFLNPESVARELLKLREFQKSGIRILNGAAYGKSGADIEIKISKPVLTSYFTYTLNARTANVLIGAGRIMAWDGETGAPMLAAKIATDLFGSATPVK